MHFTFLPLSHSPFTTLVFPFTNCCRLTAAVALVTSCASLSALASAAHADDDGRFSQSAISHISATDSVADTSTPLFPDFHDDECDIDLEEVFVTGLTGAARLRYAAAPMSVVGGSQLELQSPVNIIGALARQPGVAQISTGSGISKPVIRGLGFNRVLVVNDGVRQEGQQWGDEHGVEIDGNSVSSAEIIKGPASLMYGSDALAGVIVFNDAPTMRNGGIHASASAGYASNNGLADYSLDFRGNRNGLLWNWRWSQAWAHDYSAPGDGFVPNTRFRSRALKGMLGLARTWGTSKLIMSYYHFTPGMTEPDALPGGSPRSYATALPYQTVGHYKIVSDNMIYLGSGMLTAIVGYQQNRRWEFEEHDHSHAHAEATDVASPQHGDASGGGHDHDHDHAGGEAEAGLDFRLHTVNYDVRYAPGDIAGWRLNVGANGMWQASQNLGEEFLIPAYRLVDAGVFATTTRDFEPAGIHLSGGLRYDLRHVHSLPLTEGEAVRFTDFTRNFSALSGSVGATWEATRRLLLRLNVAHGFRAPNMSEMGSNGVHHGTFRYEIGDQQLKAEHSWQFDVGAEYAGKFVTAQVALFANRISNYIYLRRTGETMDATPVYRFTSGDARLLGGEVEINIHPLEWLHFHNGLSLVDARLIHAPSAEEKYLPFTPAPRWLSTLHCDIPHHIAWMGHSFAQIEADVNARQSHVMTAGGTETPTPGYTLWNFSLGTDFHLRSGRQLCQLSLTVSNIFNKGYQSHTSRLKYADTYALTGRYGYNDMGRNVTVRLTFPLDI